MTKNIAVKKGWELVIPLNIIFLYMLYAGFSERNLIAIAISVGILVLVNYIIFSISYRTDETYLYVKNVFFGTSKIEISKISKIEKTWNPLSSPAPSLFGRVAIYWPQNNYIIISPENFDAFKNELLSINPNIEVKE